MSDAKLQIDISANTDAAVASIKGLNTALANTEKAAAAGAKGMQTLNKASGTSTQALTNLNRVVQDAPFGLIGVANNIDPLIGSFQRLKAETGSTGGALKALVGGLAGPAGLALGISAVTSLLIAFGPQIMNFITGTDEASEAQKKFNEELGKAQQNAATTGIKLKSLLSIYQDETNSYEIRQNALRQLQKETEGYNITINEQTIASGQAVKAIDALTNSLIAQATAEKFANRAAEIRVRQIDDIKNYQKAQDELTQAQQEYNAELVKFQQGATPYKNQSRALAEVQNKVNDATANVTKAAGQYRATTQELNVAVTDTKNELEKGLVVTKQSSGADENAAKSAKKLAKAKKEVADAVKSIEQIEFERSLKFKQYSQEDADAEQNRLGKIITAEEALQKVRDEAERKRKEEINKRREDAARALEFGPQVNQTAVNKAISNFTESQKQLKEGQEIQKATELKVLAEAAQNAQAAFGLLSPAIDAVFSSLSQGTNVAQAVSQAIKQLVIDLIKAVVQAALLNAIFTLLNPGKAAAGAGMTFKQLLFKGLGFAGGKAIGGPVSGGQGYIVGENGPELFVPGTPGSIVPNMALSGAGGGNVSFEIRGDVLYGLLRRTANNKMANFG